MLDMKDFEMLEKIGSSSGSEVEPKVYEFLWNIITNSKQSSEDLLNKCITKLAEMLHYKDLAVKKPFFDRLPEQVQKTENSVLPVLKLFKKLI